MTGTGSTVRRGLAGRGPGCADGDFRDGCARSTTPGLTCVHHQDPATRSAGSSSSSASPAHTRGSRYDRMTPVGCPGSGEDVRRT